jgi:hypothetical protein
MTLLHEPTSPETRDPSWSDVRPERLEKAYELLIRNGKAIGQDWFEHVIIQLGCEPYVTVRDGKWELHDLTELQTIALAAAVTALKETLHGP